MSEIITAVGQSVGGVLSATAWRPPADLTRANWRNAGEAFGAMESSVMWWLGDWYNAYRHDKWGSLAEIFQDDWHGPAMSTCQHGATVCNAFDICRRRQILTWQHHAEVASLAVSKDPAERELADHLLDWCEEPVADCGEPRTIRELRARKRELTRAAHIEDMRFPDGRYGVIYIDPPWRYDFAKTDNRKIENHYPTMSQEELLAFPLGDCAAENAMLFMWAVNPQLPEALELLQAWGFSYVTNAVWVKDKIGMGYHVRAQHELLLIARRGDIPPPAEDCRFPSVIFADRGAHSAKPVEVYDRIEAAYPTLPKIEVFARGARPGWTCWGNQLAQEEAA